MEKLDKEKLLESISDEVERLKRDIEIAGSMGWYQRAAEKELIKYGAEKIARIVRRGDFTIKEM